VNKTFIDVPLEEYIRLNNHLSEQYKSEKDYIRRQDIIKNLYLLDIPLFRSWKVFNMEDREDFEQEAYLWIERALETFKPGKGAFLNWLKRWYVLKSWTAEQSRYAKQGVTEQLDGTEPVEEDRSDFMFWNKVQKSCSEDEWKVLNAVFFDGRTYADLEAETGKNRVYWAKVKSAVFNRIRDITIKGQTKSYQNTDFFKENIWIPITEFASRFRYSLQHTKSLVSNGKRPGFYIDRRDLIHEPRTRIHCATDADGRLVLPRFHHRKKTTRETP